MNGGRKRYFNTKQGAERHLLFRQRCAYKRIEKRGDKIIRDNSYVYEDFLWSKPEKMENCELYSSTQTKIKKWYVFLAITTEQMLTDLKNIKSIDYENELELILQKIK